MAVQLTIDFETLVELAKQLKPEDQQALIEHLQTAAKERELTNEEFRLLFESMIVDLGPVPDNYSFRREDWYGDYVGQRH